jgi:phage gp36-like protein
MADAAALELLASTVIVADGAATAVEVEDGQQVAALTVSCTVYTESSAGSSIKVYIERRANTSEAWEPNRFQTTDDNGSLTTAEYLIFTATGHQRVGVEIGPLTRIRYDLTNMTTCTLACAGTMSTVYAAPSDLGKVLIGRALAELDSTAKVDACLAANDLADGYLGLAYVLPLTAWGADLTLQTARLAVALALTVRGADITTGPDALVYQERDRAEKWFNLVAAGRIKPPGLVDTTPEVYDTGAVIASRPSRWGCR